MPHATEVDVIIGGGGVAGTVTAAALQQIVLGQETLGA